MTVSTGISISSTGLLTAARETIAVGCRHVLIIDDEEDIREIVQLALETVGGWEVFTAESGSEGLIQAEIQQPDAILLDMMMPDMDGFTTLANLQANPTTRDIPVIFITAKVETIDRNRCAELGVVAIIAKPFDPMRLTTQIANILSWD
jgi:CheY-like chemotaxis protein